MYCDTCNREQCYMQGSDETKCLYCCLESICEKEGYNKSCGINDDCMFLEE